MKTRRAVALLMVHLFGLESSALATVRASGAAHAATAPAAPVPTVGEELLSAASTGVPSRPALPPAGLTATPVPRPFDFNLWTREGDPGAGAWNVESATSVTQLLAATPTFFVAERDEVNTTSTGQLHVGPAGAPWSGAIGFLLAYRAPLAAEGHAPQQLDLVLLRWTAGGDPQNPGGLTALRVEGPVLDAAAALRAPGHPAVTTLAESVGPGLGWLPDRDYAIELVHRRSRVALTIDGVPRLELGGDFAAGRLGFFTDAQSDATFSGFASTASNSGPAADAGPDQALEATGACGAWVTLDGSGSGDRDGDRLSFLWEGSFGTAAGESPQVFVPVGSHVVTLTVDDGNGALATDTLTVDVSDTAPPLLACPADVAVTPEPGACEVPLPELGLPTAVDNCGIADLTNDAPATVLQGQTLVTWAATDAAGLRTTCGQRVAVADVVAPALDAALAVTQLWPPSHDLEDVGLASSATDACGAAAPSTFLEVWSDEPDEGSGDGNHPGDAVLDQGVLRLRSERQGGGDGRVYLVAVTALDAAGNADVACMTAVVPKSAAAGRLADVLEQADAAARHCDATGGGAPPGFHLLLDEALERANRAPEASAGPDAFLTLPENTLVLQGNAADDGLPEPTRLTTRWTRLEGPADVAFEDPASVATSVELPEEGAYVLRLTASDGELTASDDVRVTLLAENAAPVVDAGPDRTLELPAATVTLAGAVADDGNPVGSQLTVVWSSVSGPAPVVFATPGAATTAARFGAAGSYTVRLTATDGELETSDDVLVTVLPENLPPQVDAGPDRTLLLPETSLSLAGSASDDGLPSGGQLSVFWSLVSGPAAVVFTPLDAATTTATFAVAGDYVLRLSATDTQATAVDDVVVSVTNPNQAPQVDAGPDLALTLPADVAALDGSVSDDGLPFGTLTLEWSQVSGPAAVSFTDASAEDTDVRFVQSGTYVLRLAASDGELAGEDSTTVVVSPPPLPTLSVEDVSVVETDSGFTSAELKVRLSSPSPDPVEVDYVTRDGSALAPSDFEARFGRLQFAPGETGAVVSVPVAGDLLPEGDETFDLALGNPSGALLPAASATVAILDDDDANVPPLPPSGLQPVDGSEAFASPTLTWTASDPDGEPLSFDVYLGAAVGDGSPSWTARQGFASPLARSRAATGYEAGSDRLIVFGGRTSAGPAGDVWVLRDAAADGVLPAWTELAPAGVGPGPREGALAELDPETGRLIVHGGCSAGCASSAADAWLLAGADASAPPEWLPLPDAPQPRALAVSGYDPASNRLIVFGGLAEGGDLDDLWVLKDANGLGAPEWEPLTAAGTPPAPRHAAAGAYDPVSNRLFVVGGRDLAGQAFGDVWVLEHASGLGGSPTWTRLEPQGPAPAPRSGHAAHWDAARNRLVVFGGSTAGLASDENFVFADVWRLAPHDGGFRWLSASPTGALPPPRLHASAAYEPRSGRLLVALGENNRTPPSPLADVWVLEDAAGSLPLMATGLPSPELAPSGLAFGERYLWQVVARDASGAEAYSNAVSFSLTLPRLSVADASVVEGDVGTTDLVFDLTLSAGDQPVSVDYATADDSARAGEDYEAAAGTLDLPPGTIGASLVVAVSGDALAEPDETLRLVLSNPIGARLERSEARGVVLDDDTVVTPPDLAPAALDAAGVTVDGQSLAASGELRFDVLNLGDQASGPFGMIVFEDRDLDGGFGAADAVLGSASSTGVAGGSSRPFAVAVSGALSFAGNLLSVFVDSGAEVVESDEANNLASTAAPCEPPDPGPFGGFAARLEWQWSASTTAPTSTDVLMTPAVVDLNGDGVPDVVFSTSSGQSFAEGTLRAIDGRDARELFSVADPALAVYSGAHPAVGDLDGDGRPEIVAVRGSNDGLLAFGGDGTLQWTSPTLERVNQGGVAIADLDGDGAPEVAVGRQLLRGSDGALLWTGTAGAGRGLPVVADVDLQGDQELVAGDTAYRSDGSILWRAAPGLINGSLGRVALGNFDPDPTPEIAVVTGGSTLGWVYLLEGDTGAVIWGPVTIPGGGSGAPVVADFDGDGAPEFGVAGAEFFVLFEGDGGIRWQAPIDDRSSSSTTAAAFDFDLDGAAEVVHRDHDVLRILSGVDGRVLFETPLTSGTLTEGPVVADVDGDGQAEILVGGDSIFGGSTRGLLLFGGPGAGWPAARPVWNQHSYHVTNVEDDGTIPAREVPSWLDHGTYRSNVPAPGCAFRAADLVPSFVRIERVGAERVITARIGNAGDAVAVQGLEAAFYDGNPGLGGRLLGTAALGGAGLLQGGFRDVQLALPLEATTRGSVWVVADDDGRGRGILNEWDEGNNAYDSRLALRAPEDLPDLTVTEVSGAAVDAVTLELSGSASALVRNQGEAAAAAFDVVFFEDRDGDGAFDPAADALLAASTGPGLGAGEEWRLAVEPLGTVSFAGVPISVFVDSGGAVSESDEGNNVGRTGELCRASFASGVFSPEIEWAWTGSPNLPASTNVAVAPAIADLDGDGVPDVVFVSAAGDPGALAGGTLRAVRGADGSALFDVTDPALAVRGFANPALGDLDGDGLPEVVTLNAARSRLLAFSPDGSLLWQSDPTQGASNQPLAIADLDGDGSPEIVLGRQAFDSGGRLLWTGSAGDGYGTVAQTHVADLDGDGSPEVITGHTAYRADGSVYWQSTAIPDNFTAVADLDADPFPEVVVTAPFGFAASRVTIAEHTGEVKAISPVIDGFQASSPTLADLDGDRLVEIALAHKEQLVVLNRLGQLEWTQPLEHDGGGAGVMGAPVAFDFDADGDAELVHGDNSALRVYDGRGGGVLAEVDVGSCDGYRTPVVADVDADGNAEIVFTVDRSCGAGAPAGVYVVGDGRDGWVGTRGVWNQMTYHVTNVEDDAGIPPREVDNWAALNSFRQQSLEFGLATLSPDLTASFPRASVQGSDVVVTVRIGNGGAASAPAGLGVAFYDGDPRAGGALLGSTTTATVLPPGGFEDVTLVLPGETPSDASIWAAADDDGSGAGRVRECDEENNLVDSGAFANRPPAVDAGADQSLGLPADTVLLAGTVIDDGLPVGSTPSAAWSQVGGPDPAVFADAASPSTQVTLGGAGLYVLRLTGSDGSREASDDVEILLTPPNQAPVAEAGPDQSITLPPETSVVLQGSASDDGLPLPASLVVSWSVASAPPGGSVSFSDPLSPATTATFSAPGPYALRLTADDGELQAADSLTVLVVAGDTPPVVDAGPDQTLTLPTLVADLAGSAVDDGRPTGALDVRWSVASGPGPVVFADPRAAVTTARFETAGTYVLRLAADDSASTVEDLVSVVIGGRDPEGEAPFVELSSPADGAPLTSFTPVAGTVRSDSLAVWSLAHRLVPDGEWVVFATGDTPVESGVLASFDPTLLLNGLTQIRLRATDLAGRTGEDVASVVVRDNLKVGNFTLSFVDLEVPVSGLPIRITRTYDSREKGRRDFGIGWSLDVASVRLQESGTGGLGWQGSSTGGAFATYCLDATRPHVATVTLPDGRVHEFDMTVSPSCQSFVPIQEVQVGFQARPGSLGTLVPLTGAALVVSSWPGQAQLYDSAGFALYDPALYQYTSPDGRAFVLHDAEGLKTLRDLNGNVLSVTASGIEHSSGRGVVFERDALGRIVSIADPEGEVMRYSYDLAGDLVAYADREEGTSRYRYDGRHGLLEIEDPRGITPIRNEYDDSGRLTAHVDAFGKRIEYTHSIGTRREIIEDRTGGQRVLEYDERGNVVLETQPDGKQILRTFDERNNRLSETEPHEPGTPDPPTTAFTYDSNDNLLSTTDPLGNTTSQTYDENQRVLTSTDARQSTTVNAYDARGNLLTTTDPAGGITTFTYDAAGNVLTQTDAENGFTEFECDGFGNLTRETDAEGTETTHAYDASGNRTSTTTTRTTPSGPETLTTTFVYDRTGRLVETIDPDGTSTRTDYDALGKQVRSFDKLGRMTEFEYDEMGRLVKTTFPDLTTEESEYDAEGRRNASIDREGRRTEFEYDPQGRLRKTTFADLSFTENVYDDAGRLESTRDARGNVTRFEYDAAGRRTKVIDALAQEVAFGYDANGNQTSITDARGNTTTFEYDDLNRRTRTTFPDTTFTQTAYDELGRRLSETDQAGKVTRFEYDGLGRLVKVTDALGQETTYGYDEQGNRVRQTDANGHTTLFEYDELGRQTRRTLPGEAFETMSYDAAGNLASRTDFNGLTTTYSYDENNRLVSRSYPDPSQDVRFTYTSMGNRESATDSRGTTVYTYDNKNRLETLTYPDGRKLTYGYDANGNRTSLTAEVGGQTITTTYTYDALNRLETVTDSEGRDYVHEYDPNGNRSTLTYPNNTETTYVYDDLNRLTNLTTVNTATLGMIQSYQYTLGAAGNRERIDEHDGTARVYTYDDLYRLEEEAVSDSVGLVYEKSFVYDPVGNRESQTTVGTGAPGTPLEPGTIDYTYDDRDRILTEGTQPYGWDENGNLVTKDGEASYTWDFEKRLTRVGRTDGTVVTHAYDADGNRVETTTTPLAGSPEVTKYLVDSSGTLSHVVIESSGAGGISALYVRGDELVAVVRPTETRYYHEDGLGSIRRLTNETGLITDGYSYTAFGELVAHTGTDPQPYAFSGEPLDPSVGWQYHRARWMDPEIGRFPGPDPWLGSPLEPGTLHRFQYAASDPVNRVDPSGWLSNFVLGNEVHRQVGLDFAASGPQRFSNRGPSYILGFRVPFVGRLRPDLIDVKNKQLYEIKTIRQIPLGHFELTGYLLIFNWADPDKSKPWTRGTAANYRPPTTIGLGFGAFALVGAPVGGVIAYEAFDLKLTLAGLVGVAIQQTSVTGAAVSTRVGVSLALRF